MWSSPRKPHRKPKPRAAEVGVHRIEPGEDHGLDLLEAGERCRGGPPIVGQGVADGDIGHLLDPGDHEANLTGL
jgi:hypothetical protein